MSANIYDIQKGMDVYDSNGQKIGTVGDMSDTSGAGQTATATRDPGLLGDDSRVYTDTGSGGGPGTLGDESRVYGGAGTGGGAESLGDESEITGTRPSAAGYGTDAGAATDTGSDVVDMVVVEETVTVPGPEAAMEETGAMAGAGQQYFEVDHGGFLGIGTQHLHVPYSAVQDVVPGDRVILNVSKDEAASLYAESH